RSHRQDALRRLGVAHGLHHSVTNSRQGRAACAQQVDERLPLGAAGEVLGVEDLDELRRAVRRLAHQARPLHDESPCLLPRAALGLQRPHFLHSLVAHTRNHSAVPSLGWWLARRYAAPRLYSVTISSRIAS